MSDDELYFRELAAGMPAARLEPLPPDLWPRIAASHASRQRRRRWRRLATGGSVVALVAGLAFSLTAWRHAVAPDIDWQSRAQALELQLDSLPMPAAKNPMAQLAESELAHLDSNLQAAYDRGAARGDMDALWQRRCELLDALLSVRRQQTLSTRI
ncbi:MAG: hypothetical protein JSR27_01290 [Proteobacteria bacterium]|nr:hypothetical protein [Pseudomonadota bacterium]